MQEETRNFSREKNSKNETKVKAREKHSKRDDV